MRQTAAQQLARRISAVGSAVLLAAAAGCATSKPSAPMRPLSAQEVEEARLDPEVRAVLAGIPELPAGPLSPGEQARRARERWESLAPYTAPKARAQVRDVQIETSSGPLRLRTYRAEGPAGALPAVLFLHGGGYVAGTLDLYDSLCRRLAQKAQALVIAVDYRRAPESRFPAALADVHEAVRYLHAHATELGGDPARVALAGDGAGAALAVAEAVELGRKGEGLPAPRALALAYPLADARITSASWQRLGGRSYLIAPEDVRATLALYLAPAQLSDPRVSPVLFADRDLRPLPRTLVVVAELDPALDDGEELATRLRAAAVKVVLKREPGMVHGFLLMAGVVEAALRSLDGMGDFIRASLAQGW
jgi:acetyl esterase